MKRLEGKVAIVTGAGAGIGLATTRRFAEEGAKVISADVNEATLQRLRDLPGAVPVLANVTVQADVDRLVAAAQELGGLDILVNNAGIMDGFLPAGEVTDALWQRVLAVNLTGPMLLCRASLPVMQRAGRGVIINVSSAAGLSGAMAGAAYTSSKHGLVGLTKHVAAAYASDGVRCVAIAPGAVNTGMDVGGDPNPRGWATLQKVLPASPRVGEPAEIANLVLFLASDEASFLNGAIIPVDGGWLAY